MDHGLDLKNYQSYRSNYSQWFLSSFQVLKKKIIGKSFIDFILTCKVGFMVEDNLQSVGEPQSIVNLLAPHNSFLIQLFWVFLGVCYSCVFGPFMVFLTLQNFLILRFFRLNGTENRINIALQSLIDNNNHQDSSLILLLS